MNKYRNKPVTVDGIRFASKAEARRYGELLLLQKARKISDLERQPRYRMDVYGTHICTYVGDFIYREGDFIYREGGRKIVVEDVKGTQTPVFKLKAKLMKALYPHIELRIVK